MLHRVWTLLRDTVEGFVNDGAMSRGAAIAYYTIFWRGSESAIFGSHRRAKSAGL